MLKVTHIGADCFESKTVDAVLVDEDTVEVVLLGGKGTTYKKKLQREGTSHRYCKDEVEAILFQLRKLDEEIAEADVQIQKLNEKLKTVNRELAALKQAKQICSVLVNTQEPVCPQTPAVPPSSTSSAAMDLF